MSKSISRPGSKHFAQSAEEAIEVLTGARGDGMDAALTRGEALEAGIISVRHNGRIISRTPGSRGGGVILPPGGGSLPPIRPHGPLNVQAVGALAMVFITFDTPNYKSHAYAEIWRSAADDIGQAVQIGTTQFTTYADNVGTSALYYYWVRFVSSSNDTGPWNRTAGTIGQTSNDPAYLLTILAGQIGESQLTTALNGSLSGMSGQISILETASLDLQAADALLSSSIAANAAAITSEATARYDADVAEALLRQTLAARVDLAETTITSNVAAINNEAIARADADSAEAALRETLAARVDSNELDIAANIAAITSEATTRAAADAAEALLRQGLAARVDQTELNITSNFAAINNEAAARASADDAEALLRQAIEARVTQSELDIVTNFSAINNEAIVRANADAAEAALRQAVSAKADNNEAGIQQEMSVRAQTVAPDFDPLAIYLYGDTVQFAGAVHRCTVQQTGPGLVPADWALASSVYAQYTVKVDANGKVLGIGLSNDGPGNATDEMIITADRFAIGMTGDDPWQANTIYEEGAVCRPTNSTERYFFVIVTPGTSGAIEPAWPIIESATIADGTAVWQAIADGTVDLVWSPDTAVAYNDTVQPLIPNGWRYKCSDALGGVFGAVEPLWSTDGSPTTTYGMTFIPERQYTKTYPFVVAMVAGKPVVVMAGAHIADGTIDDAKIGSLSASKITAGTITAAVEMTGPTITGGLIRTSSGLGRRVEMDAAGYPIWFGDGVKSWENAIFAIDQVGNSKYAGHLEGASGTFSGALTADAINAVDTINLAGQAVTIPASAYTEGATPRLPVNSWYEIQSLTVVSEGNPAKIDWQFFKDYSTISALRIKRDSVIIHEATIAENIYTNHLHNGFFIDTPSLGAHTYTLEVYNTSGLLADPTKRGISYLETKR